MGWIFGYGSLMWRPGFRFEEARQARVHGLHRAFCVYSHVHRGTPEQPGLVLGLMRGGSVRGMAYRVAPGDWDDVVDYLRRREQATAVYLERNVGLKFDDGTKQRALTYTADPGHYQYAGRISMDEQVQLVRQGVGQSGKNPDYVASTVRHMEEMGIVDGPLHDLLERLIAEGIVKE